MDVVMGCVEDREFLAFFVIMGKISKVIKAKGLSQYYDPIWVH